MNLTPDSADTTETVTQTEVPNTLPSLEDGGELVETISIAPAKEAKPEDKPDAKPEDAPDGDEKKETEDDAKDDAKDDREKAIPRDRFDKVNDTAKRVPDLEKEIANLKGQVEAYTKQTPAKQADDDFIDKLSSMDADDLRDQMDDDPAAFLKQYADALTAKITIGKPEPGDELESKVVETLTGFAKENPEFDKLWDAGGIQKHMEAHPGYDAIGSFYALTSESRETAIQEKIDEAVKKTEAKFNKLLKRDVASLPGGPAATAGSVAAPELQDTSKHGGVIQAIASRILAGRQTG